MLSEDYFAWTRGAISNLKLYLWCIANVGTMPIDLFLFVQYEHLEAPVFLCFVYLILLRVIIALYS